MSADEFDSAVEWFVALQDQDKGQVIQAIAGEAENIAAADRGYVRDIVLTIQEDLAETDTETAVERLIEKGVQKGYSQVLVEHTLKYAPPSQMMYAGLEAIDRDDFDKVVRRGVFEYIDHYESEIELQSASEIELQSRHLVRVVQEALMAILRGAMTSDSMRVFLIERGLSEARVDHMLDVFDRHQETVYQRVLFRNIQDYIDDELQDLKDQQRRTHGLMNEILTLIENAAQADDT